MRLGLLGFLVVGLVAAAQIDAGYKPVAGPGPMRTAAAASLAAARDWLAQKDLASLAQAGPELELLARLLAAQGSSPDWLKGTATLEDLARKLAPACRAKDAARAGEILAGYGEQLKALETVATGEAKAQPAFKAGGGVKTWMLALDFAYHEAKLGKSPDKVAEFARALAEEANAVQFLRPDATWRTHSQQVRDHALRAADAAQAKKPDEAKAFLQKAFERCEACHQKK